MLRGFVFTGEAILFVGIKIRGNHQSGSMQSLCPEPRWGLSAILRFTLENRW